MITEEDPLWGLLFYWDPGFSHTLDVLKERRRKREHTGVSTDTSTERKSESDQNSDVNPIVARCLANPKP